MLHVDEALCRHVGALQGDLQLQRRVLTRISLIFSLTHTIDIRVRLSEVLPLAPSEV